MPNGESPPIVSSYEDLLVYKKLLALHLEISRLTMDFPHYEMYELGSQLRRSSNSIPANLAEGWNNKHTTLYIEGVNRSLGELRETRHHLRVALEKRHITETLFGNLEGRLQECGKMLRGLLRKLEVRASKRSRKT